jgi:outer membrane protein assembly factor BamB
VATAPRAGPTVFIGSFDGDFYALNARTGGVRWRHSGGGKIFGAPTVVGRVVYFSNLGLRNTLGLNVSNGRRVWRFGHGAFSPVISDGKRIYLTTYRTLFALGPKGAKPQGRARKPRKAGRRKRH